jgi:hypothetical protein
VTTVLTSHTGKPVVQNPAVQVPQHHLPDIGAIKSVLPLKPFFVDLLESLKVVLYALVVWRVLGIALAIYGFRHGFPIFSSQEQNQILSQNPCRIEQTG